MGFDCDSLAEIVMPASEASLACAVQKLANELEFDHFIVGVQVFQPFGTPRQHITNGYPSRWRRRYDEMNYISVDPTVRHCVTQGTPLLWDESVFGGGARPMWEEAKAAGLSHGLSIPARLGHGSVSMLSLARDKPLEKSPERTFETLRKAALLAYCAHIANEKLFVPDLMKSMAPTITKRERECLQWASAGKSAWDISQILHISERTAVFHLANAQKKLGVTNRTQAVVAALSLQLI